MTDHGAEQQSNDGYEKTDASVKLIVISAIILTIVVIASFFIVRLTYVAMEKGVARNADPVAPMGKTDVLPPAPRLRLNAPQRLADLHRNEDELLNSYALVDEANGIARIPIARAKQLLAQAAGAPVAADDAHAPVDVEIEPTPVTDAAPHAHDGDDHTITNTP
ncbi:MAG: hypothetical protein OSB41_00920 [Kiritimatiellae bacterium]|nr:hypothetical protein [Kiritimatiellia bacterium]